MKVYILEVSYYGDWSGYAAFSTYELADKCGAEMEANDDCCAYIICEYTVDEYK